MAISSQTLKEILQKTKTFKAQLNTTLHDLVDGVTLHDLANGLKDSFHSIQD
jgi:hypothetical protein